MIDPGTNWNSVTVAEYLRAYLPRSLVLTIGQSLSAGAVRAHAASKHMRDGHRANVLGSMRHFHMNETFSDALEEANVKATPLQGNKVIVGEIGPVRFGRFNLPKGIWNNARRSKSRRAMAEANAAVKSNMLGDLFGAPPEVHTMSAFFVAVFSGSKHVSPEAPISIDIAVPAPDMKSWLFSEPLSQFIDGYMIIDDNKEQVDGAFPALRAVKIPKNNGDDDSTA